MASTWLLVWLSTALVLQSCAKASVLFSSRLIHRFSEEMKLSSGATEEGLWPVRGSLDYYQRLLVRDFQRQKIKLGHRHQLVFPSEGSQAMSFGNDLGWLHYTWIDIGTPNISFLVAVDDGSDLLWVPCNCIQCYPLSASYSSSVSIHIFIGFHVAVVCF
ncbi:hypothetical protein V2J09_016274 [Rumex salicifolius]